jgi:hypothetical protein
MMKNVNFGSLNKAINNKEYKKLFTLIDVEIVTKKLYFENSYMRKI